MQIFVCKEGDQCLVLLSNLDEVDRNSDELPLVFTAHGQFDNLTTIKAMQVSLSRKASRELDLLPDPDGDEVLDEMEDAWQEAFDTLIGFADSILLFEQKTSQGEDLKVSRPRPTRSSTIVVGDGSKPPSPQSRIQRTMDATVSDLLTQLEKLDKEGVRAMNKKIQERLRADQDSSSKGGTKPNG